VPVVVEQLGLAGLEEENANQEVHTRNGQPVRRLIEEAAALVESARGGWTSKLLLAGGMSNFDVRAS
jgi:hypothetical protein